MAKLSSSTPKKQPSTKTTKQEPLTPLNEHFTPVLTKHQLATNTGDYGEIQVVTSNRLKRRFCNSGYLTQLYIPDVNYTRLSIIGLQLGITVDEVIRGLIEAHLSGNDQLTTLKYFAPALQL